MKEAKIFVLYLFVTKLKVAMALPEGISLCSDRKTVCINGGYCSKGEGHDYSCQCRDCSANCETKVSDLCYNSAAWGEAQVSQSQHFSFCINEGRCATNSDDGRPYCVCKENAFTGPHCELSADRFLQLVGIPTASPSAFNSTNEIRSLSPSSADQSDAPNSEPSLAPSTSLNETSLAPSRAPSIENNSSSLPTLSVVPSTALSSPPSTFLPSLSTYPTSTFWPTGSAIPTITTLPTITAIPSTSDPTNTPSANPSAAPSVVVATSSPTERPIQERPPIPDPPPFVAPTPSRTDTKSNEEGGLNKGVLVGIGLLATAVVSLSFILYYRRRRRYSQPGRMLDGDLELTNNYLDDQDGWANQRPLTAGTRHSDALI